MTAKRIASQGLGSLMDRGVVDLSPAARVAHVATSLYAMAGPKISIMFLATIPSGLVLGAVEVASAFLFYLLLARFDLVSTTAMPAWLPNAVDPLLLLAIVSVLVAALRYLTQVIPSVANSAFDTRIRQALARRALNGPGEGGELSVAEVSHFAGAVAGKAGGFVQGLTSSLSTFSLLALITGELAYLSWQLTFLSLAGAVVLGFPILLLKPISGRSSDRHYFAYQAFTYRLLKDVRNAHFLKICGISRREIARLDDISRAAYSHSRDAALVNGVSTNLPSLAGIALILGLLVLNQRLHLVAPADLVPFVYLLYRSIGSLAALSAGTGLMRECLPHVLELYRHAESLFPKVAEQAEAGEAASVLSSLDVRSLEYGRREPLTPPLSLQLRSGEMVLVMGSSGRGKTTLLLTLLGLVPPLAGTIEWGGVPLNRLNASALRRKIGFAGPEPYLVDGDIRSNLVFGIDRVDVTDAEIDRALRIACAEFVHNLDGGLGHRLREQGDGISAGQKQRIALARCLLRRAEVLILDEATANIDEETERAIFTRLFEGYPDLMIVAVSHRSSLRGFATKVIEI
jgi:ABC-type multidrug transport system fused ATPase/permease subunit